MKRETRKSVLSPILIGFFVVLLFIATYTNFPRGVNATPWVIPFIMAIVGLIGAAIGSVLGGIIGLIGKLFKLDAFIPALKYGAAIGYLSLLAFWFLICWMNGSSVCLAQ